MLEITKSEIKDNMSGFLKVTDVCYNESSVPVEISVRESMTKEDILKILDLRCKMDFILFRDAAEKKRYENAVKSLEKPDKALNALKTLQKYSFYKEFDNVLVSDVLTQKTIPSMNMEAETEDEKRKVSLMKLIFEQSVKSLEMSGIIHPKLKLLINDYGKIGKEVVLKEKKDFSFGLQVNAISEEEQKNLMENILSED